MRIYTLTLNPAYDVHASCGRFAAGHENLARILSREAGGKGVNLSRALAANGIANTAVIVLGTQNSGDFKQELRGIGLDCVYLERPGRIRENLTLHCADAPETRISFSGFAVDDGVLTEVAEALEVAPNTVITFTGRVPDGISMDAVKAFLAKLRSRGARIVLDSKSFTLEDIFEVRPWLIKPNQEEISQYLGCNIDTIGDAVARIEQFEDRGVANVMVSLGEQGALLRSGGRCFVARPPKVEAVSTIGAGDSTIAGFIAASAQGRALPDCLKLAVSYGTAACMTVGSRPPRKTDVEAVFDRIEVTEVV